MTIKSSISTWLNSVNPIFKLQAQPWLQKITTHFKATDSVTVWTAVSVLAFLIIAFDIFSKPLFVGITALVLCGAVVFICKKINEEINKNE